MKEGFNPQEILKIAINIEENGKALYGALEEKTEDAQLKELWGYLKDQEEEHRKTFTKMLDNLDDYIVHEYSSGDYDAYMKAIASNYVFTQGLVEKKKKELFESDQDAIDFGIYIEKESILTYQALKDYITLDKQEVISKVIDEEKKHLARLIDIRNRFVSE